MEEKRKQKAVQAEEQGISIHHVGLNSLNSLTLVSYFKSVDFLRNNQSFCKIIELHGVRLEQ